MDITVLAETQPKDSYQEVGLQFYRQYAIGHNLTEQDKQWLIDNYRMREVYNWIDPVITLSRRVDDRSGNLSYWEWSYFDAFENQEKAIYGFGDSYYWNNCTSTHPLHAQAVAKSQKENALRQEMEKLEAQITCEKFQTQSPLYRGYWNQAIAELKAKRVYKAYQENRCPQNVLDEIKERIGGEYRAELERIQNRIDEIKAELKALLS